jgi:hypothetical protein
MSRCLEWGEERHSECAAYEDQGYNSCSDWDSRCCTWWPCSWACKLVTWVCVAWFWVSNIVCVVWNVITTIVCVVWDGVTTVVNAIVVTLESIVGWVLDAIGFVVELIFAIPFLGRLLEWIWNFVLTIVWGLVSLIDAVLGALGIRPEKKLRICTVILPDEDGTPIAPTSYVVDLLQAAVDTWRREANVRLIPLQPFNYDSGFAGAEQVSDDWVQVLSGSSDNDVLDLPCGLDGAGRDLGVTGSKLKLLAGTRCFFGSFRRILGYGAPVTCFVIRSLPDEDDPTCGAFGCALWITDYITVRVQPCRTSPDVNRRVVAHELGHACNLWHLDASSNSDNLMGVPWDPAEPELFQTQLAWWQVVLARSSKHVTYF